MINIDYILSLLDWNNSDEEQEKGVKLAKDIKCISAFIQPGHPYGKNIWDNCAKILAERGDKELEPHLIELLEWLQDMNWPGAFCIFDRLKKMLDVPGFQYSYNVCMKCAKALDDEAWINNLEMLKEEN